MEYEQDLADIHCSRFEQDLSKNFQEERHCKFLQWLKCLHSLDMILSAEFLFQCPRRMKDRQTFGHAISPSNLHLLPFHQTIHRVLSDEPSVQSLLLNLRKYPNNGQCNWTSLHHIRCMVSDNQEGARDLRNKKFCNVEDLDSPVSLKMQ